MASFRSAILDDDSSGEEFVPEVEEPDKDEKIRVKKKRKEAPVELLQDDELDSMWAEMNGGPVKTSDNHAKPVVKPSTAESKTGSNRSPAASVDVQALLAQLQEAEQPEAQTETVRFAGQEVQVKVTVRMHRFACFVLACLLTSLCLCLGAEKGQYESTDGRSERQDEANQHD